MSRVYAPNRLNLISSVDFYAQGLLRLLWVVKLNPVCDETTGVLQAVAGGLKQTVSRSGFKCGAPV